MEPGQDKKAQHERGHRLQADQESPPCYRNPDDLQIMIKAVKDADIAKRDGNYETKRNELQSKESLLR